MDKRGINMKVKNLVKNEILEVKLVDYNKDKNRAVVEVLEGRFKGKYAVVRYSDLII